VKGCSTVRRGGSSPYKTRLRGRKRREEVNSGNAKSKNADSDLSKDRDLKDKSVFDALYSFSKENAI